MNVTSQGVIFTVPQICAYFVDNPHNLAVVSNENNDVTMFREVNCKMQLFAMKYSIEFEEKIN
jgi:hypothetical protein